MVRIPCTPSSGKGAVQTLPPALVGHFLFPYRDVRAVIAGFGVVWRQRSAIESKGGVVRWSSGGIRLECGSGALGGHDLVCIRGQYCIETSLLTWTTPGGLTAVSSTQGPSHAPFWRRDESV